MAGVVSRQMIFQIPFLKVQACVRQKHGVLSRLKLVSATEMGIQVCLIF